MGDSMKILYKQNSETSIKTASSVLNIQNSYLKEITFKNDHKKTTYKSHYHTEYEIHMIFCGKQCYEIGGVIYDVHENEFILIPPNIKHRVVFASENLLKYSITFNSTDIRCDICYHGMMTETVINSISFISEEFRKKMPTAPFLIRNRILEVLILLFRIIGCHEINTDTEIHIGDTRLELAKKFISDNIEQNLLVTDVASYCHLSTRQLSRLFLDTEGVSPGKYINSEKMKKIGECIRNSDLSLLQISTQFSYNNEYYFNTSFKKYFGMPPSMYRKMFVTLQKQS